MNVMLIALRAVALALLVIVITIGLIGLQGGRFNRTASHPIGLYWIVDAEPQVGLYAQFCIPVPLSDLPPVDTVFVPPCALGAPGSPLLKRITHIDAERDAYTVQGDHPRSLDSRVFGPIKRSDITAVMTPVWTVGQPQSYTTTPEIGTPPKATSITSVTNQ